MKVKIEITAKALSDIPDRVTFWETEIGIAAGQASSFVIAIQKVVNRFMTKVNQHDNTFKGL